MPAHHTIDPTPSTVHWAFFDATLDPVLEIEFGDTVTLHTVSGGRDILPSGPGFEILPDHQAIHEKVEQGGAGHIMTGPVAVRGAKAGDVLEVRIKDVDAAAGLGLEPHPPARAARLPEDFPTSACCTSRSTRSRWSPSCPGASTCRWRLSSA